MKAQNQYAKYFQEKKKRGELRSALTFAQWTKAGKPKPKLHTSRTKAIGKRLKVAGLSKKEIARLRD